MPNTAPAADTELLRKLLAGELPPAEADRLAAAYAADGRLAAMGQALDAGDTLFGGLSDTSQTSDPTDDQMAERLVSRMKAEISRRDETLAHPADDDAGPADDPTATAAPGADGDDASEPMPDMLEYFRVEKILGQGGMGMVYLATDTRLNRKVAIKTLKKELSAKAAAKERFFREAQAAAALDHDHIIPIHYVGESKGIPFIAMPYLKGEPLDQFIKKAKGPMPLPTALRIGREVALGLAAAHEAGLIHRDIKPANVWLEAPRGRAKILDFGLARSQSDDAHLTASGVIMGTPAYMAPEQARGLPVDARADLFSLGVMLYELTTGKKPFTGRDMMAVLTSLALDTPAAANVVNPAVPANLSDLISRLLAKEPGRRPMSAKAVADELSHLATLASRPTFEELPLLAPAADPWGDIEDTAAPTEAVAASLPEARPAKRRPNRWLLPAASVLGLLIVMAAAVVIIRDKNGKKIAEIEVPEGGKVEIADGSGPAKPAAPISGGPAMPAKRDGDRAAAEWVFKMNGYMTLDDKPDVARRPQDLPTAPFTMRAVNVGGPLITDDGMKVFEGCRDLVAVDLSKAPVTAAGVEAFKNCRRLGLLNLAYTKVETGLPAVLKNFPDLHYLNLHGLPVSDEQLREIQNLPNLTYVILYDTKVTAAGVKEFAAAAPQCKVDWAGGVVEPTAVADDRAAVEWALGVGGAVQIAGAGRVVKAADLPKTPVKARMLLLPSNSPKITDQSLAAVKDLRHLTELHMTDVAIGDAGIAHFGKCRQLTGLFIPYTPVSDAGLNVFAGCNFKKVNLTGTKVTGAGLDALKNSIDLDSLNVGGLSVTDADLARLTTFEKLKELSLDGTKVTAAGVAKFAAARPECRITWDGGVVKPLTFAADRTAAEYVIALGGGVGFDGDHRDPITAVNKFPKAPFRLTFIHLSGRTAVTDADLAKLKDCKNLQLLDLWATKVTDAGLDYFKDNTGITELHLESTKITDVGLAKLRVYAGLTTLGLERAPVTDAGLNTLKAFPRLKILSLDGCPDLTDAGVKQLKVVPGLEQLSLSNTAVTEAAMADVAGIKTLKFLALTGLPLTDEGLARLAAGLNDLTNLNVDKTKVTAKGVAAAAKTLPNCRIAWDGGVVQPTGLTPAAAARWLLDNKKLNAVGVTAAGNDEVTNLPALPGGPFKVRSLNFHPTNNGGKLTEADIPRLAAFTDLHELILSRQPLTDAGLSSLANLRELRRLEVTVTELTPKGADAIRAFSKLEHFQGPTDDTWLAALAGLPALRSVQVYMTPVTDDALGRFKDYPKLAELSLVSFPMTEAGLLRLSSAKSLRLLTLVEMGLKPEAVEKLAKAMPNCEIRLQGPEGPPAVYNKAPVSADRKAAEYALSVGGTVEVNGQLPEIKRAADLPPGDLKLQVVTLKGNDRVTDAALAVFGPCKNLKRIILDDQSVTDAGLANFRDCKALVTLSLSKTRVTGAGLAHFKDCKNLEGVVLNDTAAGDAALAHLKECANLKSVCLERTDVTDAGLTHLKGLKQLFELRLAGTKVTAAAVQALAKELPKCSVSWDGGVIEPGPK